MCYIAITWGKRKRGRAAFMAPAQAPARTGLINQTATLMGLAWQRLCDFLVAPAYAASKGTGESTLSGAVQAKGQQAKACFRNANAG